MYARGPRARSILSETDRARDIAAVAPIDGNHRGGTLQLSPDHFTVVMSDPSTLFSHDPLLHPPSAPTPTSSVRHRHPFALRPSHGPRHAHLLRLYNLLLHLLSLPPSRQTTIRTLRAWRALAGCREIELDGLWAVGAKVLDRVEGEQDEEEAGERRVDWLRTCQDSKVDQEGKFVELVLGLIAIGRAREALGELDGLVAPSQFNQLRPRQLTTILIYPDCSFLPSRPYHDSIGLHVLAGTLTLYLSQPRSSDDNSDDDTNNKQQTTQPSSTHTNNSSTLTADQDGRGGKSFFSPN